MFAVRNQLPVRNVGRMTVQAQVIFMRRSLELEVSGDRERLFLEQTGIGTSMRVLVGPDGVLVSCDGMGR